MPQDTQERRDVSQIAPGSTGQVSIGGTWRPFQVLAVRERWVLLEYWRQDPGHPCSSGLRLLDLPAWQQGEERDRYIGYHALSDAWLHALTEAGAHWHGQPLRGSPVPSPRDLLAQRRASA
jgi:hypothetical protein